MVDPTRQPAPPHAVDPDGVRVVPIAPPARRAGRRTAIAVALAVGLAVGGIVLWQPSPAPDARPVAAANSGAATPAPIERAAPADDRSARALPRSSHAMPTTPTQPTDPIDWPSGDPRDLAAHFRPGDPEPTAGEVIRALQDAGDFTGLGAFNPPGTSPPLQGLAVPEGFVLPPGFVRHHQVTDDGVPLEPILMFAPDLVLHDAAGGVIPLPDDRVVPPELAPPGLPRRAADIPPP